MDVSTRDPGPVGTTDSLQGRSPGGVKSTESRPFQFVPRSPSNSFLLNAGPYDLKESHDRLAPMETSELSDEALMLAYLGGEHAAFRVLFDRCSPVLWSLVRRSLPSDEDALEIVQQTFLQLHCARDDFRPDARLRPWLFTIAKNLVRDFYRERKRHPRTSLESMGELPGAPTRDPMEIRELRQEVRAAIAALPDDQREAVELHWFQDRPFAEIASLAGVRPGAVRVRAHRGYKKLRELLSREEDEEDNIQ